MLHNIFGGICEIHSFDRINWKCIFMLTIQIIQMKIDSDKKSGFLQSSRMNLENIK